MSEKLFFLWAETLSEKTQLLFGLVDVSISLTKDKRI